MRKKDIKKLFDSCIMKELIISKHSKKHPPLVTQERNLQREPIDGIFTTPGIKGIEAGYLGFKESGKYDH